jgi:hypothetical protein
VISSKEDGLRDRHTASVAGPASVVRTLATSQSSCRSICSRVSVASLWWLSDGPCWRAYGIALLAGMKRKSDAPPIMRFN